MDDEERVVSIGGCCGFVLRNRGPQEELWWNCRWINHATVTHTTGGLCVSTSLIKEFVTLHGLIINHRVE